MKRRLVHHNKGEASAVTSVITFLLVLGIAVLLVYNIMGAVQPGTDLEHKVNEARGYTPGFDDWNNSTSAGNATGEILSQTATFFQVAPILAIVIVAMVIIAYVKKV